MWKPVTIKPNDQSLCGRKVNRADCVSYGDDGVTILHVGEEYFFGKGLVETSYPITMDLLIWEEPKPKKLMAPAYVKGWKYGRIRPSLEIFESESEAKSFFEFNGFKQDEFISWPAKLVDGYYEVPE